MSLVATARSMQVPGSFEELSYAFDLVPSLIIYLEADKFIVFLLLCKYD
jgi:hypothetical protein